MQKATDSDMPHRSEIHILQSRIQIYGIDCMDCGQKLVAKLENHPGITAVQFSFPMGVLQVSHICPLDDVIEFIEKNGYRSEEIAYGLAADVKSIGDLIIHLLIVILSVLLIVAGFIGPTYGVNAKLAAYFFPAAMVIGGYRIYRAAWQSIKNLVIDQNLLVTLASVGALGIKIWPEAAVALVLFNISQLIQKALSDKLRTPFKQRAMMVPAQARRVHFGNEEIVNVDALKLDDTILVKAEEFVTGDGRIISGSSIVNQSFLNGDETPVEKKEGDRVFAGSINTEGTFSAKITRLAEDTFQMKILNLTKDALNENSSQQQFANKLSKYYVPMVLSIAFLGIILSVGMYNAPFVGWFHKALVLLIIASPCLLQNSTMTPIFSAIGNAAARGILIKDTAIFKNLVKTKTIAFAKRGIFTTGELSVAMLILDENVIEEELLQLAAAVEIHSDHPIARAIVKEAESKEITFQDSHSFIAYPGKGVRARLGEKQIHVGSYKLINELNINVGHMAEQASQLEKEAGYTLVYISQEYKLMGIIALWDGPKEDAGEMIQALRGCYGNEIMIISGDHEGAVANIAGQIGIEAYRDGLLPEEKAALLEALSTKGNTVMVGDGIKDALALKGSTIGIAMRSAGPEAALETADVIIMDDTLMKVPFLVKLASQTTGIIKQNLTLAIIVKTILILLTLTGSVNLWGAVITEAMFSILITLNSLRLAKYSL